MVIIIKTNLIIMKMDPITLIIITEFMMIIMKIIINLMKEAKEIQNMMTL